jgi:predicted Zn-dependent protease
VLVLEPADGPALRWPYAQIRGIPDQADRTALVVALDGNPVARLVLREPGVVQEIRLRCPALGRRPVPRGRGRLAIWAVAAVASVALIVFVLVPLMADQLAEYLPPEGEKALGDATLEQIRTALSDNEFMPMAFCERRAGRAALDRLVGQVDAGVMLPYAIDVHVLDSGIVNAFALPGGHIVFFRGLIEAAEEPAEVAAVFAHELGHVVHRDPTRTTLRSAGSIGVLGLLLGDFAGGSVVLFLTNWLIEASYSQDAEAAADAFAHARMIAAGQRPDALATIFERLKQEYGDDEGFLRHFAAHPTLGNRIEAARRASQGLPGDGRPLLSAAEWEALKGICG